MIAALIGKSEEKEFKYSKGLFLYSNEVGLSIDSVTLAITSAQSIHEGYSCIPATMVANLGHTVEGTPNQDSDVLVVNTMAFDPFTFRNAIRFLRPMIIPIFIDNHITTMIIQLDDTGKSELLVLDSRPYHYKQSGKLCF